MNGEVKKRRTNAMLVAVDHGINSADLSEKESVNVL